MAQTETDLTSSWLLLLRNTAIGVGLSAAGYFMVQTEETVVVILGACFLIAGPIMVLLPVFMGLPGKGPCPECGTSVETIASSASDMLCGVCNTYLDAGERKLRRSDPQRVAPEPRYAAPTPWPDISNVVFPTVAFSIQDKIQDMLTTKGGGVRVMDARWPQACCVCGAQAARFDTAARTIAKPGNIVDTEITLVAKDVPYCKTHKDGIKFDRVQGATAGTDTGFGIHFRSLAYRNAFMKANPWKFTWR